MILHLKNILASRYFTLSILNITIEKDKSTNRFGDVFLHLTYCLIGQHLCSFTRYVSLRYSRCHSW
uniref:Uncharacterized protein n=2 Tax=Rhinopithecus TaxID=542827 RepID=A0A2K6L2Y1_RHIBE